MTTRAVLLNIFLCMWTPVIRSCDLSSYKTTFIDSASGLDSPLIDDARGALYTCICIGFKTKVLRNILDNSTKFVQISQVCHIGIPMHFAPLFQIANSIHWLMSMWVELQYIPKHMHMILLCLCLILIFVLVLIGWIPMISWYRGGSLWLQVAEEQTWLY